MGTIAVVDDRNEARDLVKQRIERALRAAGLAGDWQVTSSAPLQSPEAYASWLVDEEVQVLVLDERLNEGGAQSVRYRGHDVIRRLKPRLFDLPVYYLTAVPHEPAVEADASKVQGVIDRTAFLRDPQDWVIDFDREGKRYQRRVARKLGRLSELAQNAARGQASDDELREAAALRQELQLPFESGAGDEEARTKTRDSLLLGLDQEVQRLERLTRDFTRHIANPERVRGQKKARRTARKAKRTRRS